MKVSRVRYQFWVEIRFERIECARSDHFLRNLRFLFAIHISFVVRLLKRTTPRVCWCFWSSMCCGLLLKVTFFSTHKMMIIEVKCVLWGPKTWPAFDISVNIRFLKMTYSPPKVNLLQMRGMFKIEPHIIPVLTATHCNGQNIQRILREI